MYADPMELATVCVYDFFSWYALTGGYKTRKTTMQLNNKHPSKDHLKVVKRNDHVIPCISYLDIPETKSLGACKLKVTYLTLIQIILSYITWKNMQNQWQFCFVHSLTYN
jgi:hypothetical protein